MKRFTNSIRLSIETKNWYSALYLALTMPDICARLESPDGKTNGPRFVSWFDRYMLTNYRVQIGRDPQPHTFLSGNDCYALRCAMLHEGTSDITTQRCREALGQFHFTIGSAHCNQINSILQIDVPTFCREICSATEQWLIDFQSNHPDKVHRLAELLTIHTGPSSIGNLIAFS